MTTFILLLPWLCVCGIYLASIIAWGWFRSTSALFMLLACVFYGMGLGTYATLQSITAKKYVMHIADGQDKVFIDIRFCGFTHRMEVRQQEEPQS